MVHWGGGEYEQNWRSESGNEGPSNEFHEPTHNRPMNDLEDMSGWD